MISSKDKRKLFSLLAEIGEEVEYIKNGISDSNIQLKDDKSPVSKADIFVNDELCKYINTTQITNIISEENKNLGFEYRKKWDYFWCLDPIDGTKELISKGNDYTINIALCFKDYPIFSAVYAPARRELYVAENQKGAKLNQKKISAKKIFNKELKIAVSKSHLDNLTKDFLKKLEDNHEIEILQYGSSLKICKVADGSIDLYPRFGTTMEWDTCASDLILKEANGCLFTKNNLALKYNKRNLENQCFIAKPNKLNIFFY